MKGRLLGAVVCAYAILAGAIGASAATAAPAQVAPGAPGAQSFFDLARKDCVGTARNTTSRVWFTVAGGVLSDVYWPNVDATNVHTLQYLVSDGSTFTDVQTRDMSYSVVPDPTGMACTVVASSTKHHYRIVTTYIADPSRDAVLMHVKFEGPDRDQVYVRLDPLAGGTGGGGTQNAGPNTATLERFGGDLVPAVQNQNTITQASNRDYAVPTFAALDASHGFSDASVGYAGTASDGLTMLDTARHLTTFDSAPDGHVVLTAQLRLRHGDSTDLALGFGKEQRTALRTAQTAVRQRFDRAWRQYERQWLRYDGGLRRPSPRLGLSAIREYYESVNVVKASEDKQFPGAIAAGLASPWGQAVPAGNLSNGKPTYFGSYREVFARDLYEAFAGLLVAGDIGTARDAALFLFERQQQADGSMPRNSLLNGEVAPDTGGLQLDETSYPILMAWQSGLAGDRSLYRNHVIPAADFLVAHGPSDGVERWEEQSGFSPSTIAAEIAGLTAASRIAAVNGDRLRSRLYQAVADDFARNIKLWTVTDTGAYSSISPSYFIRVSKTGDPNAAITYNLGNGSVTADQRAIVDAGFLELVRLGILPASDPTVQSSLNVIDKVIKAQTSTGAGFYRYGTDTTGSEDGYGDCFTPDPTSCPADGQPWPTTNTGSGHPWPVLAGERGEYEVAAGDSASALTLLSTMRAMTSGQGLEPEQAWEDPDLPAAPFGSDPTTASIGFANGHPAGSASPLTWAQSQYARLTLAWGAGRALETPAITLRRYVANGMPGTIPLSVTSPANGSQVTSSTVQVSGTTAAGARVDAEAVGANGGTAGTADANAGPSGAWSLTLPVGFGTTTITVTATSGNNTAYSQLAVTNVTLPGNNALTAPDPTGDDNGPGTFQYPTDPQFQSGAFDLTDLKVNQDTSNVYIQVALRNLAPTFGAAFGAQLLDVFVRQPGASPTSTAAPFTSRNYSIATADAWSQRLELQGFASPIWVDASNNSLGNPQFIVDQASDTATVVLPKATFGTVSTGWVFTVVLTGQDGFSSDQARGFAATPQPFQFGVCASGGTSPICAVDPTTMPKVMDTIPPAGVSQSTELDPTAGPVVIQGVPVP